MSHLVNSQPPRLLSLLAYWFRLGLVLFVAVSAMLGVTGCSPPTVAAVTWQDATRLSDQQTLKQIVESHTSDSPEPTESIVNRMRVWATEGELGMLKIYNFNTPHLCGSLGCLYTGYLEPAGTDSPGFGQEVFTAYLDPNLEPDIPLFQAKPEDRAGLDRGLPCLLMNQLEGGGNRIRQIEYCFNGRSYQLAEDRLFSGQT
ncbi:MAG: hypothetical protein F6K58_12950 [Symploca sp. SIO2E9]|nr:hypothetical protein [Symploca sp. SIO2E9]